MFITTAHEQGANSRALQFIEQQFREYALFLCRNGDRLDARQPDQQSLHAC